MSHQVAQKRAITTLPCVSSARTVPPAGVGRLKAGSCVALAGAVRPAGSGGESAADTVRATEVRSAPSIAVSRDRDVVIGPPVSCLMIRQGAYITKHAPVPRCQRRLLYAVYRCTTVTVHANDVLRRAVADTLDWGHVWSSTIGAWIQVASTAVLHRGRTAVIRVVAPITGAKLP